VENVVKVDTAGTLALFHDFVAAMWYYPMWDRCEEMTEEKDPEWMWGPVVLLIPECPCEECMPAH